MTALVQTEHAQQTALFMWASQNFERWPELRLMFAIPSGGLRNKIVATNLKAEGVRRGIPDIFLPVARGSWHGLFVEMKKQGGYATPEQKEMIDLLRAQGYGAVICVGFEMARDTLITYLNWSST